MSKKCPVCGKAEKEGREPFCSKRCADVDLGHWFKGNYSISGHEEPDEDEVVEAIKSGNFKGDLPQS